jgi:excisionase family DNA binding protein
MLTLGQAAKLTGISKTSLRRAIVDGRLAATRADDWVYQIERSALARLYSLPYEESETVVPAPVAMAAASAVTEIEAGPSSAANTTDGAPITRWREASPPRRSGTGQGFLQRILGFFHLPSPASRSS